MMLKSGIATAKPLSGEGELPADVRVYSTDLGPVYADAHGYTLYSWDGDTKGVSNCTSLKSEHATTAVTGIKHYYPDPDKRPTCLMMWPPLLAHSAEKSIGAWTIIDRPDGLKQWAYEDKPAYRSALDDRPGDVNGINIGTGGGGGFRGGERHPLRSDASLPPGVALTTTKWGRALAIENGDLLYFRSAMGQEKARSCNVECRSVWKPFLASGLQMGHGDWSILSIQRGARQWAYKGKPLFSFDRPVKNNRLPMEKTPGWQVAVIQSLPAPPAEFTVTMTSIGEVYADANGKTLYYFVCAEETADHLPCDVRGTSPAARLGMCGGPEKCRRTFFPVLAKRSAKAPNHTWTIVKIDKVSYGRLADESLDGAMVWAYRGRPLYTYVEDRDAGDIEGNLTMFAIGEYAYIKLGE